MAIFQLLLKTTFSLMTVFIFGSAGEIVTEKSGHLNMGIPGIMALGGLGGIVGECLYINNIADPSNPNVFLVIFIPVLFTLLFAALGGLFFSFFSVTLRCNQNVVGLCLTTLGVGIATYFLSAARVLDFSNLTKAAKYFKSLFFPGQITTDMGFFVDVFLSQGILTYLSIIVVILCGFIINKTRVGLSLRAVGENPAAADSIGINVKKYRYLATIIGSAIAGLGGLYLLMDYTGGGDPAGINIESYGWLSVALVIFSMWRPGFAIIGSIIFAMFSTLPGVIPSSGALKEFLKMLPYILTIIILIITSMMKFKNSQAPSGLGQSYFREDR